MSRSQRTLRTALALMLAVSGVAASAVSAAASSDPSQPVNQRNACQAGWEYDVTQTYGQEFLGLPGGTYKDYNGTASNARASFTSNVSGTIGVAVSTGAKVDVGAVVVGAEVSVNTTLTASVNAGLGNTMAITVPSHQFGYGSWGAWRWHTYGSYYYVSQQCAQSSRQTFGTWVPNVAPGWKTWTARS